MDNWHCNWCEQFFGFYSLCLNAEFQSILTWMTVLLLRGYIHRQYYYQQSRRICSFFRGFHLSYRALMYDSNRAFCSFPDSLQFDQGSQSHSFRVRELMKTVHTDKRQPTQDGFIYGYSHFTQKRDSGSKRGYEQVSRLPLVMIGHSIRVFPSAPS